MDRLHFFKILGLGLGGAALSAKEGALAGALVGKAAPRFRAAAGGEIQVSRDGGASWERHAAFGPGYEVQSVREGRAGTVAQVCFQGTHSFQLRLDPGGRHWTA